MASELEFVSGNLTFWPSLWTILNRFGYYLTYIPEDPWVFLVSSKLLFVYGAGFTSPASAQRYAIFIFLCLYTWRVLACFMSHVSTTSYLGSIVAGAIVAIPLTYFDRLLLRKWSFENRCIIFATAKDPQGNLLTGRNDAKTINDSDGSASRFTFGNEVGSSIRGPGTPWEVKGIPHFSNSDPEWVPSLTSFILWRLAIIFGCFVVHNYVVRVRMALDQDFLQPSRIPFLTRMGEVTRDELWTRMVVTISFWTTSYCILQVLFNVPAIIAVCLKPQSLRQWRPAFGSVLDAFTVRKFWA